MWVISQRSQLYLIRQVSRHRDLLLGRGSRVRGTLQHVSRCSIRGMGKGKRRKWMPKKPVSHTLFRAHLLSLGLPLLQKGRSGGRIGEFKAARRLRKMAWLKITSSRFDLNFPYFHSLLSVFIPQDDFDIFSCHSSSWPCPHFSSRMS